jgi:cytochrome oxidase Cu insertion factor (SCO1/SenC/PrrC family)
MRRRRRIAITALVAMVLVVSLFGQGMKLPKPQKEFVAGVQAPDFTLKDQDGHDLTLSALRGNPVLLVFYRGYW